MSDDTKLDRVLAWASAKSAALGDCWLVTAAAGGGASTRIVEPMPREPDEPDWTVWVLVGRNSRKAREIGLTNRVTLCRYEPADRSYLVLAGAAALIDDRTILRARWKEAWNAHFPGGAEDPRAVLLRLDVDRIEVCAPGLSPEPFASGYTTVERGAGRDWALR